MTYLGLFAILPCASTCSSQMPHSAQFYLAAQNATENSPLQAIIIFVH